MCVFLFNSGRWFRCFKIMFLTVEQDEFICWKCQHKFLNSSKVSKLHLHSRSSYLHSWRQYTSAVRWGSCFRAARVLQVNSVLDRVGVMTRKVPGPPYFGYRTAFLRARGRVQEHVHTYEYTVSVSGHFKTRGPKQACVHTTWHWHTRLGQSYWLPSWSPTSHVDWQYGH